MDKLSFFSIATIADAIQHQLNMRGLVRFDPLNKATVSQITALKAMCLSAKVAAVAIRIRLANWEVEQVGIGETPITFPYQPGFYAYCVAPAMFQALAQLNAVGDVIIVEGHGVAHPRRFGLASFMGVYLDKPTIGCARNRLVGEVGEISDDEGSYSEMIDDGEVIGVAYRSRKGCKPVYLSVGNRLDLTSLLSLCVDWFKGYRLPEPLRMANHYLRISIQKEF